ncbi:alpha-D-ribose 1-methylphosphonate 5-triphosphate diphosphatase [Sulfitobacter sp. S190]|uniref:alpha-D-ribose 1-methylphosphonate 5-triphosphate diphosphatase n=1 Tax=Sulfitobacter sp. S190 TaxID=2867022 RepID=UPI0021A60EB6|nr:alpha-D-ribose 1-methylphosphonate 5-triphosphate diphosphatase [Sulfitobacter sp. S190]UWR23147.1 alpha-D-ribose 1-methylphosphonate 5-triphosphate diphosphatase [Sulfitobacter sp. S190]
MLNLELVGADVLRPEGLRRDTLAFADGVILAAGAGRRVDLGGYIVLPGIVDVHGDGFERHVAPRRGAMKQMTEGLVAVEAELAANGITTAVLAQFVSWEGGLRSLEFAETVFDALQQVARGAVTDLRAQLRFETHLLDLYDSLPERLAQWGVSYVVFNDHLPHDRLAAGRTPKRLVAQALKAARNPEMHHAMMRDLHARRDEVPAALDVLCARLAERGITMGSHDDRTAKARAAWDARGVRVAEFPETAEAAEAARGAVVLGAPNVVRGGSHNGNVSALDLVAMGVGDALASDYHYPSPRRAALMLWKSGVLDLAAAWRLVSEGPARVLGLRDRGTFDPGQRADMVILDAADHRVAATIAGGRVSHMTGDIAARFIDA